jgi:hypothetical protein
MTGMITTTTAHARRKTTRLAADDLNKLDTNRPSMMNADRCSNDRIITTAILAQSSLVRFILPDVVMINRLDAVL